jgi:hypothetical protein
MTCCNMHCLLYVCRCVHAGQQESWLMQDATRAWAFVRALLAFVEEVPEAAPNTSLRAAAHTVQVCACKQSVLCCWRSTGVYVCVYVCTSMS